jgi:hypothetical protein
MLLYAQESNINMDTKGPFDLGFKNCFLVLKFSKNRNLFDNTIL